METIDDSTLVRAACGGDRQAYGDLVSRYGLVVHAVCAGIVGAPRAPELAHEAFVEAWLRLASLRDPARFAPWLRALTANLCRMWHRRERRRRDREADEVDLDALAATPRGGADLDALMAGLEQLSRDHRLALALHYWQGLTCEQIAAFLDVPTGTVLSRLHRARGQLRERMETVTSDDTGRAGPDPFRDAVDGEIEVLLQLWQEQSEGGGARGLTFSEAGKRLSELSRSSPDTVRPVLIYMNEALVEHAALLLRRAGAPAVDVAVACAFDDDATLAASARRVLRRAIGKAVGQPHNQPFLRLPLRETLTWVLDAAFRGPHTDAERAEMLAGLLDGCEDDASLILLAAALRCCGDAGFDAVHERWRAEVDAGALHTQTMAALARFGSPFLAAMADALDDGGDAAHPKTAAALNSLDVGTGLLGGADLFREPAPDSSIETRVHGRLRRQQLDADAIARLQAHLESLVDTRDDWVRARAVALLGALGEARHIPRLRQALADGASTVRNAAVSALLAREDEGCVPQLLQVAADDDDVGVRRMALQAIGRFAPAAARDALVDLLDDAQVAPQAITALGELGDAARDVLEGLLRSGDRKKAKLAASALFGRGEARAPSQLRRERLARVRGADAEPALLGSVVGAIRNLPELRPYPEAELTRRIGEVCHDYSTTRRELVMGGPGSRPGLMTRADGVYELTEYGRAVWRVERILRERDPRQRGLTDA